MLLNYLNNHMNAWIQMTINSGLFSSNTDNWATPIDFFNKIDSEFNFTLDVCADSSNAKCKHYFDKTTNGLLMKWYGNCWMNPPYGRIIYDWIKYADQQVNEKNCNLVVALLPARTDTKWFHEIIYNKYEIRFIKGRLKFGNSKSPAPFPSMLVIFKK